MPLRAWFARSEPQPGAPGLRTLDVSAEEWRSVAEDLCAAGGALMALWASPREGVTCILRAAFLTELGGLVLNLRLDDPDTQYPGIEDLFPAAARMQRAAADLAGVRSTDPDTRPWLRHGAWPERFRPLIDSHPARRLRPRQRLTRTFRACGRRGRA